MNEWQEAVNDAAVVNWTLTAENENNPRKAVADLIAMVQRMDFDPAISRVAAKAKLCDEHKAYLEDVIKSHDPRTKRETMLAVRLTVEERNWLAAYDALSPTQETVSGDSEEKR